MKLLVVESNINIQRLYKDEFEEEGYDVILASSGKDALEKFERCNPDVVTMEILMPDTDGTAILRLMKEKRPGTPVLLSTGFDFGGDFGVLPADECMLKSSDLRELKAHIKRFAEAKSMGET